MYGYIYLILNKLDGKTYVGKHKLYDKKWNEDNYMGSGIKLKPAQEKYGIENFEKFLITWTYSEEDAIEKEKFWIAEYRSRGKAEYNIADGGDGGNIAPWTEERKKKISESKKELFSSEKGNEVKKKISNSKKEFFDSDAGQIWRKQKSENMKKYIEEHPEFREIAGASNIGRPSWNKGVECTYKEKISVCLKEYFKEHKQDPKSQPKYRLIRCIETGEEYGQNEWARMGYSHAGQIARGYGRSKSDHGKHFEFVE